MTEQKTPLVYIFLPVHNRREITLAFVDCLKKQSYRNYQLVLIDDGSKDGTSEAVKESMDDVTVICGKGNWWWAGSLQQGHEWLMKNMIDGNDVVLIMNDDTAFEEDFIAIGVRILKDNPKALLTATGYNLKTGKSQDSGGYKLNWANLGFAETYENAEINCASTRGLMVRGSDFLDVKGFYPRLIPHYLSDLEFTMRAQKKGKKLIIHPEFRIGIDFETTGHRELGKETFAEYLKKVFSKRAAMNPVHWSNYILLHSPWKYKLSNLRRIWGGVYQQGVRERLIPELKEKLPKLPKTSKLLELPRVPILKMRTPNFRRLLPKVPLNKFVGRMHCMTGRIKLRLRTMAGLSLLATVVVAAIDVYFGVEYIVKPDNTIARASLGEFGISLSQAEFLTHFSGKLIEHVPEDSGELKQQIRENIVDGFKQDGWRMSQQEHFDSDREKLIVYAMLRVNGSLPIYQVGALPLDLTGMLTDRNGNCGVASTRLLMVLESLEIKARAISWFSSSLPGHVFVSVYDEAEKKAYMLDPSNNIWSKFDNVDKGYIETISAMNLKERKSYLLKNTKILPSYLEEIDGVQQDMNTYREYQRLSSKDSIVSALSYELPAAMEHWKRQFPMATPYSLEWFASGNACSQKIPLHSDAYKEYIANCHTLKFTLEKFNPQYSLAVETLLHMAGINTQDFQPTNSLARIAQ